MHLPIACSTLVLLCAAAAPAQDLLGTLNRTDTSFTSRGSAGVPNTNPSVAFNRLDHEYYAGWGYDPANPGMRRIVGMQVFLQDQIGNTPETFDALIYGEDPAGPDYPNVNAPLGAVLGIPTPPTTITTAFPFSMNITFATPVLAPAAADVFVAVGLPQPVGTTWPNDGLSVHAFYYIGVTSGFFDLPGAAHPPTSMATASNGGWYVANPLNPPTYTATPRQWKMDLIVGGATGVAGTITNQTSAPLSNFAPGTSSQASGLHPDAANPPLNPGRADDVCGRWYRSSAPNGTPVLFLLDLGTFFPEIPVASLLPGSTGVACLNPATLALLGIAFTNAGEAFYPILLPASSRGILPGMSIVHQAVALTPTGAADAGPCTRQVF